MLQRLIWSNFAAQAAEQVSLAATPIVAALVLGATPAEAGALGAAQTLPFLLLSVPAGLLADRMARRRLMVMAELLRAVALAALPLLAWAGALSIPTLGVIGFLAATATVVYSVTAPALVPSLVPRAGLAQANARLELARSVAFAAGPALAGALLAWTSASLAFALAAALSVGAAVLLAGLPPGAPELGAPRPDPWLALKQGTAFAATHVYIRPILLTSIAWNLGWFVMQATYALYASQRLGFGAAEIGGTLGLYGVGMIVGASLAGRLSRRISFGALIAVGPAASVLASALLALTIVGPVWLAYVAMFTFGAGPIVWTIAQTTLRQAVTPPGMLGRVSALMMMCSFGARPAGALLGGAVGSAYGLDAAILLSLALFGVQGVVIAASTLPGLRALPA